MTNIDNLMSQLGSSSNPMAMLMSMLNPSQKQLASQFQGKTNQEQAEEIANKCNQLGITKEQLQGIINMFKR